MTLSLGLDTPLPEENPFSVTDIVVALRRRVNEFAPFWAEGEVSGFKRHSSGHWYFTLKDRVNSIPCMVWADDARRLREAPEEGMKVFVHGRLDVWLEKGVVRFQIKQLLPRPEGGFHALKVERARKALEKDGLLEAARKRPLPRFPARVGMVTSAEGAAWRDVVAVIQRRWPGCELVLIRTLVQGEGAPRAIIRALDLANRYGGLDVLIVGRGGGSKEDLNAFNDEAVARAVAASRAPTISAVGHESDTTLADLVADVRAPTPSAAAETAVPDRADLLRLLDGTRAHLAQAASGRIDMAGSRLAALAARIDRGVTRRIERVGHHLVSASRSMIASCDSRLAKDRAMEGRLAQALDALSPLKVLDRGYAVARDDAGHVLKTVANFPGGRKFRLRVADGEVRAEAS